MVARVWMGLSMMLTSLLLVAAPLLVVFWVFKYRGGYVWKGNPSKEFNWHPTFMVTGFIFCSGFSMLFYRMMTCCRKIYIKLFHFLFHGITVACVCMGFLSVYPLPTLEEFLHLVEYFKFWNWDKVNWEELTNTKVRHFYSLHSWLGLTTMVLFVLQFIVGFFSFLLCACCKGAAASCRASLVPTHSTFGLITFLMACTTALAGLTQKALMELKEPVYSQWGSSEAIVINVIGICIAAAAICITFTLSIPSIRNKTPSRMTYRTHL